MTIVNGNVSTRVQLDPRGAASGGPGAAAPTPGFGRTLWDAWKAYALRAGGYQTTVLLSVVYYLVLGPSAILARLMGQRLLDLDTRARPTYWVSREPADKTLAALERQF